MDTHVALQLAWVAQLYILSALAQPCQFPTAWRGQWYQSGIGDVTISHNSITRKGVCRDRHRDYYLLENLDEHCHQCLLILPRHHNILQYKESYCIGRDSLQSICAQIRVEAILYTLIREPSYPVACPVHDAFFMTYNNNSGGFCRSPMSYVHQCASNALFHFQFYKCQYSAYTYDQELDFRCLATWKDGSDLFLYGAFAGPDLMNKDDIYRCFIYTILGTVVYMSVSADATCRGVRTPKDGPMVLELTQDIYGWPETNCRYPRWLVAREWQDLSGRHHYVMESDGSAITSSYIGPDNTTALQSSYHCLSSTPLNNTHREGFIALVHVLDHCQSQFRCMKVKETYSDMVEIHLGDYVPEKKTTCSEDNFRSANVRMLIPAGLRGVQCPKDGRYTTIPDAASCQTEMRSSCDVDYSLDIVSTCHVKPVLQLVCLGWWNLGNKQVLLAKDAHSGIINCFSLQEEGSRLILGTDPACNLGVSTLLLHKRTFNFSVYREPCSTLEPSPPNRDVKHVDRSQDDDPGGGYIMDRPSQPTTRTVFTHQTPNYKQLHSSGTVPYYSPTLTSFLTAFTLLCVRSR